MEVVKYAGVIAGSMVKFIFGPVGGYTLGLSYVETVVLTIAGMMLSVLICSVLGKKIKHWTKRYNAKKKLFTAKNRRKVQLWRSYGLTGIAFLTPLILTPIGGTLVAVSFGEKSPKILLYMLISATLWGLVLVTAIYLLGDAALRFFGH
jgi:Na+/pantothenate symporter